MLAGVEFRGEACEAGLLDLLGFGLTGEARLFALRSGVDGFAVMAGLGAGFGAGWGGAGFGVEGICSGGGAPSSCGSISCAWAGKAARHALVSAANRRCLSMMESCARVSQRRMNGLFKWQGWLLPEPGEGGWMGQPFGLAILSSSQATAALYVL